MTIIPYDPKIQPAVFIKAEAESMTARTARNSLDSAQYAQRHLSFGNRTAYIVKHLPKMVPFPLSGVIAAQEGNGPIVQEAHYPSFQRPFTTEDSFNALSIGKLFTRTAIMQLVEAGKLDLSTPLSELLDPDEIDVPLHPPYLSQKPDKASLEQLKKHMDEITVGHLLSHTGGFVERPEDTTKKIEEGENWNRMHFYWGEHSYSNYGYQLLAVIVGKHSPYKTPTTTPLEAFRAHIENEVFKPAGMTGSPAPQRKIDCFEITKMNPPKYDNSPAPYPHGNGCWSLTAKDLLAFERTHMSPLTSDPAIGFDENRDEEGSLLGRGHPGGGPGMSSFLHRWEDRSLTIAGLFNYSGCEMTKPTLDQLLQ